jgi:hypothetical protein
MKQGTWAPWCLDGNADRNPVRGGGRGGALEHVDAVGDRFEVTGREVAHRGSSSTIAQSGQRGDGGLGGGGWRSRRPTCGSHGSGGLSHSSWR